MYIDPLDEDEYPDNTYGISSTNNDDYDDNEDGDDLDFVF